MRRREILGALGSFAAWPVAARAQALGQRRRVALLIALAENDPQTPLRIAAIWNGLRERGWTENDLQLDVRTSAAGTDRLSTYASELVASKPDVIVAGNTTALAAIRRQTATMPIVFAQVEDPVAHGYVASLARPGGNITGFSNYEEGLPGKWLELLKQLATGVVQVVFLYDPGNPAGAHALATVSARASSLGVEVAGAEVRDAPTIEGAIRSVASSRGGA